MATDDRVKVLEDEFKLIKSEIRQTLSSVRDFMLDLKLPPIQDDLGAPVKPEQPPAAVSPEQKPADSMPQNDALPSEQSMAGDMSDSNIQEPEIPMIPEPQSDFPMEEPGFPQDSLMDDNLDVNPEDTGISSGDIPVEDEVPATEDEAVVETDVSDGRSAKSQVNLLANLIRWAAKAKKEIGISQLPVFLDVYATTGFLSQEMRDIILHLAEVATDHGQDKNPGKSYLVNEEITLCMELNGMADQVPEEIRAKLHRLMELLLKRSANSNKAEIWSELLLELHGILTEGENALVPLESMRRDEIIGGNPDESDSDLLEEDKTELDDDSANDYEDSSFQDSFGAEPEPVSSAMDGSRPARLRLVLPMGNGRDQELDLGNLFIATDSNQKNNTESKVKPEKVLESRAKSGKKVDPKKKTGNSRSSTRSSKR